MTNAQIFDREVTRYGLGRRLRFSPDQNASQKNYDYIKANVEDLVNCAKNGIPNLPPVYFDFIYNENINAWAFKAEGKYFIGITTGAIFMLNLVAFRMLADSRLFDAVGNPKDEVLGLSPISGYITQAERLYQNGTRIILPKTGTRRAYAQHIIIGAILFIAGHELAHITLGHIDYIESKTGFAMLSEIESGAMVPDAFIKRQCLETQADIRSVWSRMDSAKLTHESRGNIAPPWGKSPLNESQLIFDTAFSMNLFFRLFGDIRFGTTELTLKMYPPLPLRRVMASTVSLGWIAQFWNPSLKDKAHQALRSAMHYTEYAFATILGESATGAGINDAIAAESIAHFKHLMFCMNNLQNDLIPFSFEKPQYFDAADPKNF
jgi:hypothetical protein